MVELGVLLVAVDTPHLEQEQKQDSQAAPFDTAAAGDHTGYMLGVRPGLGEHGLGDDRNQATHCEEARTSDSRSVHEAVLVAVGPLKQVAGVAEEQEVARNEAHNLQAPAEGAVLG